MQVKPGQKLLPDDHPGAKLRWNAKKPEDPVIETAVPSTKIDQVVEGVEAVSVAA